MRPTADRHVYLSDRVGHGETAEHERSVAIEPLSTASDAVITGDRMLLHVEMRRRHGGTPAH